MRSAVPVALLATRAQPPPKHHVARLSANKLITTSREAKDVASGISVACVHSSIHPLCEPKLLVRLSTTARADPESRFDGGDNALVSIRRYGYSGSRTWPIISRPFALLDWPRRYCTVAQLLSF